MLGILILLLAVYYYFIPSKRYIGVILLFALITACFQMVPLSFILAPGVTKPYDWIYAFAAIVFLFKPAIFFDRFVMLHNRYVILFLIVLVALLFNSIVYMNIETTVAIRVFRTLFNFVFLFLFVPLQKEDYRKIFTCLIYCTSAAAFLYCLQPFIRLNLLNSLIADETKFITESGIQRFFNYPVFMFPVIFFFFFAKDEFKLKFHYVLGSIILFCILLTQFRNFLIAVIVCLVFNLYLQGKLKLGAFVVYAFIGLCVFGVVDNALDNRFSNGLQDLSKGSFSTKKSAVNSILPSDLHLLSTSEYRWYHLMERVHYVLTDSKKVLFGVGLANEDARIVKKLKFIVGTTSNIDNSNVPQIDTGDITWSLLLMQIGLVGIIFFIIAQLGTFSIFFGLKDDPLMKIGLLYIVSLFISSLYMIDIVQPYNICLLMLFAGYSFHLKAEREEQRLQPA